jgi:hypothetical protein
MSNDSISTYNPASKLFQQYNNLGALAAENAYKSYYQAHGKGKPDPCGAMRQSIQNTVRYYMTKKMYPDDIIEAYSKTVVEDLINKCEKHIFKVQELAGKVNNSMKNRWQTYSKRAGTRMRQSRDNNRRTRKYKNKTFKRK